MGHRLGPRLIERGTEQLPTTVDLRHHYASVLLMQGESVVVVAERPMHPRTGGATA
ncbi:hypothetical protein [Micromonospora kangleipakensis]|uniref:hypothetical protein n=1 Tax=Micromonospora kangleipakensis TaxID=1077942 RepID=UPI0013EF06A8|nr:hypothetical protein [Micromonospora kangleipakensis]